MTNTSGAVVSSWIKLHADTALKSHVTEDDEIEFGFDGRVDLVLTRDAAERVHAELGQALTSLRERDAPAGR